MANANNIDNFEPVSYRDVPEYIAHYEELQADAFKPGVIPIQPTAMAMSPVNIKEVKL